MKNPGVVAAQQLDAQLIQQQQISGLIVVADSRNREIGHVRGMHVRVTNDGLCEIEIGLKAHGRGLFACVKGEFRPADFHAMTFRQHGLVDLSFIDKRAVAAAVVANHPTIVAEREHGVYARHEGVGQFDFAFAPATDAIFALGIEQVARSGLGSNGDRQICGHEICSGVSLPSSR